MLPIVPITWFLTFLPPWVVSPPGLHVASAEPFLLLCSARILLFCLLFETLTFSSFSSVHFKSYLVWDGGWVGITPNRRPTLFRNCEGAWLLCRCLEITHLVELKLYFMDECLLHTHGSHHSMVILQI